jgi:hypothetical protein
MGFTGVGQNNGNTTATVHISLINTVLDHPLPSIQPRSFSEWTRTSFEQSLAELYTILIGEHYKVVRFEVFTAVTMRNAVFCDVALCRSCVN